MYDYLTSVTLADLAQEGTTTRAAIARIVASLGGPEGADSIEALVGLGELDPASIDMKCLLIVGASATRVGPAGVWTPRFVR